MALETMPRCASERLNLALYVISAVQEELGARDALTATTTLAPDVGISIDVTHATDYPHSGPLSVPCLLGGGPTVSTGPSTNPVVGQIRSMRRSV